jgi:hypothetical protein
MVEPYAPPRAPIAFPVRLRFRTTRFLRLYGTMLLVAAFVFASFATLQLMLSSGPGLQNRASQFVFHDGIRRTSTLANAVALALALVLWAERQRSDRLSRRRARVLRQALAAALPAYLIGCILAILVGHGLLFVAFGQPATVVSLGAGIVTRWDFSIGAQSTVLDTLAIVTLAHFFLARWISFRIARSVKVLGALGVAVGAHFWLFSLTS